MALGILKIEGFIEWTGKRNPVMYRLKKPIEELKKLRKSKVLDIEFISTGTVKCCNLSRKEVQDLKSNVE